MKINGDEENLNETKDFFERQLDLPESATREERMTKMTQMFRLHSVDSDEEVDNFHLELKNQLKINDIFTKNINVSISQTKEE